MMKKRGLIFVLSAALILSLPTSGAASFDDFSASGTDFTRDAGRIPETAIPEDAWNPDADSFLAEQPEASARSSDFETEGSREEAARISKDFSDPAVSTVADRPAVMQKTSSYVNPMYQDVISRELLREEQDFEEVLGLAQAEGELVYYTDPDQAAAELKKKIIAREQNIVIGYRSKEDVSSTMSRQIYEKASAHTGDPKGGDYLNYQISGWNSFTSGTVDSTGYQLTFTYSISYMTTADQEEQVSRTVDSLLKNLNLSGKTDYEKVKTIYDYVCNNVVYDNANLEDDSYILKYTAYAALVNHTAVCQGYSNLLYRLLLEAGIDCRIVRGTGNGGPHAWNIVRLNGKYYSVDATWDAVFKEPYPYFLKGSVFYEDHTLDPELLEGAFAAAYPISTADYDPSAITPDPEPANPPTEDPETPTPAPENPQTPETEDPETPTPAPENPQTPETEDPETPTPAPENPQTPETEDPETPTPAPENPQTPDQDEEEQPAKETRTEEISGIPTKKTLKKGAVYTLKPTLKPASSTEPVTYKSSDTKIVTVSRKGLVKAIRPGSANITVSSGKKSVKVKITVPKTATKKITGVKSSVSVKKGKKVTLKPKLAPADSDEKITYVSKNKKVAVVSSKGVITGKKKGTTTILVKSGKITVKCIVKVK